MKAIQIIGTFLLAGILTFAGLAVAASARQATNTGWLVFPQCNATSTYNGKALPLTVYCGKNGDKILYIIPLKDLILTGNLCIEATTGFIGVLNNADALVQTGIMLVNPKAVPPATQEAILNVQPTATGYTLTIRSNRNVLISKVSKPLPDPH
jgi:hypothetical protein